MKSQTIGIRPILVQCILALLPLLAAHTAAGAEASYLTILVPGALGTFPMSVNNSMSVTGYYTTSPSTARGFIRAADGTLTTFTVPGALWVEPESINNVGDVAGFYELAANEPLAFLRFADGRTETFQPQEASPVQPQALALVVNDYHEVVGNFPWPNVASSGFIRTRDEAITPFSFSMGASYPTGVLGLNENGSVVGYTSSSQPYVYGQGFVLHPDGYYLLFSVPLPAQFTYAEATMAADINNAGVIVGWYSDCTYQCEKTETGGFVRSAEGEFTLFRAPGTLVPPLVDRFSPFGADPSITAPKSLSINASGFIAGTYKDAGGARHGFVRNPYGTLTPFDPPNGRRTSANSINDAGVVAGSFYYDWNCETSIGFLRFPVE